MMFLTLLLGLQAPPQFPIEVLKYRDVTAKIAPYEGGRLSEDGKALYTWKGNFLTILDLDTGKVLLNDVVRALFSSVNPPKGSLYTRAQEGQRGNWTPASSSMSALFFLGAPDSKTAFYWIGPHFSNERSTRFAKIDFFTKAKEPGPIVTLMGVPNTQELASGGGWRNPLIAKSAGGKPVVYVCFPRYSLEISEKAKRPPIEVFAFDGSRAWRASPSEKANPFRMFVGKTFTKPKGDWDDLQLATWIDPVNEMAIGSEFPEDALGRFFYAEHVQARRGNRIEIPKGFRSVHFEMLGSLPIFRMFSGRWLQGDSRSFILDYKNRSFKDIGPWTILGRNTWGTICLLKREDDTRVWQVWLPDPRSKKGP